MRGRQVLPFLILTPALSGCIASTVVDVVTLPVKAASSAVDAVTTSQSEADENRGREMRKREERLGKLERQYAEEMEDCDRGQENACEEARRTYAEIQALLPTVPVPPHDR